MKKIPTRLNLKKVSTKTEIHVTHTIEIPVNHNKKKKIPTAIEVYLTHTVKVPVNYKNNHK